ncbi:MAG: ribonuclease Z [Rubrobacter sp.]|nr:ribonuclease Z [Rubrobacter sp.]
MRATIIGSGTVFPTPERRQSCVAVEAGGETIVFDLGNGALRGMLLAGLDPLVIDRLLITHFHPDHTSDIPSLLFSMKYGMTEERTKPLHAIGPRPFEEFWRSFETVWKGWMIPAFPIETTELPVEPGHKTELPGGTLSWTPAEHRPESIAYRLDADGASFVYTGDTEYAESVVELARGADTLLIECSLPDEAEIPGHLTPASAARIAAEAGVGRVVLTHLFPPVLELDLVAEVGENFDGEILVAEDGMKLEI